MAFPFLIKDRWEKLKPRRIGVNESSNAERCVGLGRMLIFIVQPHTWTDQSITLLNKNRMADTVRSEKGGGRPKIHFVLRQSVPLALQKYIGFL